MRRLALFVAAVALSACQPRAQNTAASPEAPAAPAAVAPPVTAPAPAPAPAVTPAPKAPPMPTTPPASLPATPPKAARDYHADLNLTGTEPFWGVQIRAAHITLQRPDHADLTVANPGVVISGETATWAAAGGLTVTLTPGDCSDGMSDRRYPYVATVKLGSEVLKGCGVPAAGFPRTPH